MLSVRGFSAALAALVALVALLFATRSGVQGEEVYTPPVQGVNNTALFIVLPHHGFSNVHLATSQALLERYPGIKQHYVSFPLLEKKVQRVSRLAMTKEEDAQAIEFHALTSGRDYIDVLAEGMGISSSEAHISAPGLGGIDELCGRMDLYLSPWPAEEYMELYREMTALIHEIDPAVVVLDHQFVIAMDAARQNNRLHAVISPNEPLDMFAGVQPRGGFFWKYPVIGSGISFPVPWFQIPTNMYLAFRIVFKTLNMKGLKEKRKYFEQHGLFDSYDVFKLYQNDTPIIFPSTQGANVPLAFIPLNVSEVGPIVLSVAPAAEQDGQLYAWLEQAPTVLISLGSTVEYTRPKAIAMAHAIKQILDQSSVQILWKLNKGDGYDDKDMALLQTYVADGRLKIESWLSVDPTSLLESGHVVAFVHHGGANCYHESVFGGVAHVILPLWADLYNFAAMVEPLGIGLWACSQTPLLWTGECISDAVLQVIADDDKGKAIREKARLLGIEARKMPGRYGAADIIAKLAGSGKA